MNCDDVFEAWAPSDARWSNWAKPVLFATMPDGELQSAEAAPLFGLDLAPAITAPRTALAFERDDDFGPFGGWRQGSG